MKTTHLEKKRTTLIEKREDLLSRFNGAVRDRNQVDGLVHEILQTNDFLESLERIAAENAPSASAAKRYAVSSWFLTESFKKLTADQDEQFFFITGAEIEGVMVLDQWAEFAHQRRTRLGVVGDMPSTHNLLIKLEQFGHKFLAHFHSHPGNGANGSVWLSMT